MILIPDFLVPVGSQNTILLLALSSFLAGFFDAMVGGGGLIQIPALFSLLPGYSAPTLLGTNKVSSVVGTSSAAWRYAQSVKVPWRLVGWAMSGAMIGALGGAYLITIVPSSFLRSILPFLLIVVAWISFRDKNLGLESKLIYRTQLLDRFVAFFLGFLLGFYDGVFGPGTGTFLVLAWVLFFGQDFLTASASAKIVNVACNFASILWFAPGGHILWGLACTMALMNFFGAQVGARTAIKRGVLFVRRVFMVVVILLIAKTSYDAYCLSWRPLFNDLTDYVSRETGVCFQC